MTALDMTGQNLEVASLRGKVTLFVNVASQCGYTQRNYQALQAVYDHYHAYGLEIWAFPCNDFGGQEPWENLQVLEHVRQQYNVTFTMMSKIHSINTHPIFTWLRAHAPSADPAQVTGAEINWNFK